MGIVDKMKQKLGSDETADKAKDKARQAAGKAQMDDKAKGMVDKGGDRADQMSGGRASGQVDSAQDRAKGIIDENMPDS
jgi:hypothetical protein